MPTELQVVHKDRKTTLLNTYVCDIDRFECPELLSEPNKVDYLTDEESDDQAGFELKVPALKDLLNEFEMGDDVLATREMEIKQHLTDFKSRGLQPELRSTIL